MTHERRCNLATLLIGAALAGTIALALLPSAGRAKGAPGNPRIYVAGCSQPFFAPRSFAFECSSAVDPPPTPHAYGLTYRRYGAAVALASGLLKVCLVGPPQQLRVCPYEYPQPAEVSEHAYTASFRFFHIIRCTGGITGFGTHLYYGEFSYTFAGLPWVTRTRPFTDVGGPDQQPKCRPAHLARARGT
jgi:hypothetical protein